MGIHNYIRQLDPVALYTFDPAYSYINVNDVTGFFVNNTEYDCPPLRLNNTCLIYKTFGINVSAQALSYVETSSSYKSYNSSNPVFYQFSGYTSAKVYQSFILNNSATFLDADFVDAMGDITASGVYTIFFQIKVQPISGFSSTLPYYIMPDGIDFDKGTPSLNPQVRTSAGTGFGYFSYFELNGLENILYPESMSFGISSLWDEGTLAEQLIPSGFGYNSLASVTTDRFRASSELTYSKPDNLILAGSYSVTSMPKTILKFCNLEMSLNGSTIQLGSGLGVGTTLSYGTIYNIFVEVNTTSNTATMSIDYNQPVSSVSLLPSAVTTIKLGQGCSLIRDSTIEASSGISGVYKFNFPTSNAIFDNFAIYSRAITQKERRKLFDINKTINLLYASYGYNQLYDFRSLYGEPIRYIEKGTSVVNVINGNSYLLFESSGPLTFNDTFSMPYVFQQKNIENDIDYAVNIANGSSIRSYKDSNNNHISMVRSDTKTWSFSFRTSDLSGLLHANASYEHVTGNLGLVFNNGSLEFWIDDDMLVSRSGYCDGEWHSVFLVIDSGISLYIDSTFIYKYNSEYIRNDKFATLFGCGLPGANQLECDYALIGCSTNVLTSDDMKALKDNRSVYYASGKITLNNIGVQSNIFIYNRDTGILIDRMTSSNIDGTFRYINTNSFTVTVVVTGNNLLGKSYIVDPVEIK